MVHIKLPRVTTENINSIHNFQIRGGKHKVQSGIWGGRGQAQFIQKQAKIFKKYKETEKWNKIQNKMVENNQNISQITVSVNQPNLQLKEKVSHTKY